MWPQGYHYQSSCGVHLFIVRPVAHFREIQGINFNLIKKKFIDGL